MTYETISVRMNRSDRNIHWGFTVRQQADGLVIDRIEPESLSDKAGVKHSDKVEQINGRPTRGLDANTANRLIDDSYNEVRLSLQRYVTSHTCLPWTLNEKDNKMVVEDMRSGFGSGFNNGFSSNGTTGFHNNHFSGGGGATNNHFNNNSSYNTSSSTTQKNSHQSSTYHSSSNASNGHVIPTTFVGGHTNNYSSPSHRAPFTNDTHITSTTNYINQHHPQNNYNSTPAAFHHNNNNSYSAPKSTAPFSSNHGANNGGYPHHQSKPYSPIPSPSTYSYNNGGGSHPYGNGAGGTPLNQMTFINTNNLPAHHVGGVSPGGKTYYHSPSSRNHNDLSPGASIHHLQYNSPMNLYSSESAAEQYFQQTGKSPEGPVPHDKTPAYLTSEARKLIEEEARGRYSRGKSPSSQSSCFKRIAHAVGADN